MKDKYLLAIYGASSQKAIKLIEAMRAIITELKERVKLPKESKRAIKEK